jgi:hypothetical protein
VGADRMPWDYRQAALDMGRREAEKHDGVNMDDLYY